MYSSCKPFAQPNVPDCNYVDRQAWEYNVSPLQHTNIHPKNLAKYSFSVAKEELSQSMCKQFASLLLLNHLVLATAHSLNFPFLQYSNNLNYLKILCFTSYNKINIFFLIYFLIIKIILSNLIFFKRL